MRTIIQSFGDHGKTLPDIIEQLIELRKAGLLFTIPNSEYDDSYIIEYAKQTKAFIVSNDRYKDHAEKFGSASFESKGKILHWLERNLIS